MAPSSSASSSPLPFERPRTRMLAVASAALFLSVLVWFNYSAVLPLVVEEWGLSGTRAGIVFGAFQAGYLLAIVPAGLLVDRHSARYVVAVGATGAGLGSLAFALVADGFLVGTLFRFLAGVGMSGVYVPGMRFVADWYDPADRGRAMGIYVGTYSVGSGLTFLLSSAIASAVDWRTATRLLVVPAVVAIVYAATAEFDGTAAVSTDGGTDADADLSLSGFVADSRALFTAGFAMAMLVVMMNGLFYRGTLTFLPDMLGGFLADAAGSVRVIDPESPVAEEFDLSSYVYSGLLMVGIAGQFVGGKVSDRVSPTLGLSAVFAALCVVAVAFVPAAETGLVTLLAASAVLGFLLFALQPLYQATIAEYSPPDDRGLSYGYTYLASFGIGATGAAIAGFLLSTVGTDGTFLALAVFPATGAVLALSMARSWVS
ncbi:MFS transporter [Halobacteriales archaeon QS_5_68_33]|nr:MAG: MFS transporter [Halobacteriales archaeon QS_5_68_33]